MEDVAWKLETFIPMDLDIAGILGHIAAEIEHRGLSEHVQFDEPHGA